MLFAAAEPNPVDLYKTLVVLQFLGGLVLLGAQLIALARTNKAQKREVTFGFEPASKVEFDRHVKLTNQTLEKLAKDSDERRRAIYEKLEKLGDNVRSEVTHVREHVAALGKGVELLDQRTVLMDQKLDRAIERRRAM